MARILIVDDDRQFRKMLRKTLEHEGYEVIEAADGKEGIKKYSQKPTDLVITDILMPDFSGISVISNLKRNFPETRIIAISGGGTAYNPNDYLAYAEQIGANYIIEKPVEKHVLLAAIRKLLVS